MSSVIDDIDQRTNLVGRNRLELLLFRLAGKQLFGINVFKVREVIKCPPLNKIPHADNVVRGVATMRGVTMAVVDLARAIRAGTLPDTEQCFVVVTEFNRRVQGFLVSGVDRIINRNWEEILPPPKAAGNRNYVTAVTHVGDELVEIVDVERVLAEILGMQASLSPELIAESTSAPKDARRVLVVDDSMVARKQIGQTLEQLGIGFDVAENGREALDKLQAWAEESPRPLSESVILVISDIEMPEMDGYTLAKEIKEDERLKDLYVLLHTSLSGVFNESMVRKVGADQFLPKFRAEDLGTAVLARLQAVEEASAAAA